jgi:hypothetical protein
MDQDTIKQLKALFVEFDATLARVCSILNRAEARVDSLAAQPAGFPPGLPPLPETPPGMRWEYIGAGTGATSECIYTFPGRFVWMESYKLTPCRDIHYAVLVPA